MNWELRKTRDGWEAEFAGAEVGLVSVGVDSLWFEASVDGGESIAVAIATRFLVRDADGLREVDPAGADPIFGALVLALRGTFLSSCSVTATGRLLLRFRDGRTIEAPPDPDYEAWQLTCPGFMLVAMPGGEVAHFPAGEGVEIDAEDLGAFLKVTELVSTQKDGDTIAPVDDEPTVFIDKTYDDGHDVLQPWPRRRRYDGESEWLASTGGTTEVDESAGFETVDEAIAWGRERAEVVLVRLGGDLESCYSAGARPASEYTDGTGWPFPPWPPARWPAYDGPPEPGWPAHYDRDDAPA